MTTPICPIHKVDMVRNSTTKSKHAGHEFWVCPQWPACKETLSIDGSVTPTAKDNGIHLDDMISAVNKGSAEAQLRLGCYFFMSDSFTQDYKEALNLFFHIVDQQDGEDRYDKGEFNHYRLQAIRLCHLAAEQGNVEAQYELGRLYERGIGVIRDYHESAKWFRLAAEQEWEHAKSSLEMVNSRLKEHDKTCYKEKFWWAKRYCNQWTLRVKINYKFNHSNLKGIIQDYEEAASWFRRSAEQGHLRAQFNLGVCLENGFGVARDLREAANWYRYAAEYDYADAQYNLGMCYANGTGVHEDFNESMRWYLRAAKLGNPTAMRTLGLLYEKNEDYPTSIYWYQLAAERGDGVAQRGLGICYYDGIGVVEDLEKSYYWLLLAAGNGVSIGFGKESEIIEFALSTEQILRIQREAKASFRRGYTADSQTT